MKLVNNLGFYRDIKKANKILLIITILYAICVFFITISVYFAIINTNFSLTLPNGYYEGYFGDDNPSLNFSFGMKNTGLFEIDNLKLKVKLDVNYYNISSKKYNTQSFFEQTQFFEKIKPLEIINYTFIGEKSCFDCEFLGNFWYNYEIVDTTYLISLVFEYDFFFNTLPVQISFTNLELNIFECPTC